MANASQHDGSARRRRACDICAKLKEKCVIDENDTICRRCRRLEKECIFTNESRKRQRTDTNHDASTIASGLPTPAASTDDRVATTDSLTTSIPPYPAISPTISPSAIISGFDDEKKKGFFNDFLNDLNQYYPMLVLDNEYRTARACEEQLPFTFAACLVAALHRHPTQQKKAAREMLNYIGIAMLMDGKKSLDLVQGLLLLIAWYQYHTQRNPQLMNLLFLAKAMLVDLGLSRAQNSTTPTGIMSSDIPQMMHGPAVGSPNSCLAGYRCVLAVYFIEAQISLAFHWLNYPAWNNQFEECCQKLMAAQASPFDRYSLQVIRLFQAVERYLLPSRTSTSTPPLIQPFIDSFRTDLDGIRASLPPDIASNDIFQLHLISCEIALYNTATTTSGGENQLPQLLQALQTLLSHINGFFDLFLSQPPEAYPLFTFLHYCQISYAVDVLGRLSFLNVPGWDLKQVRSAANFSSIMDRMMDKFDDVFFVENRRYPFLEYSRFAIFSTKLRKCRKWFEERLVKEANDATLQLQQNGAALSGSGFDTFSGTDTLSDVFWMWPVDDFQW